MRGQWIQIAENKILVTCGLPYFLLSLSFVFGVNRFVIRERQMLLTVSGGLEF